MKKILKLMLVMLAVCGISCEQLGGLVGGNDNNGDNGNGNGGSTEQPFAISVTEITSNSAYVSVVPTNDETYYFDIIEKEHLDQYADKSVFVSELIAEMKELYESYGYTLADALSLGADGYLYDGDLPADTEFYAYAVGISADGAITSAMVLEPFKTLAASGNGGGNDDVVSNNTFNISVSDITANSAQVSVTPSNNDTYYFDVIDKAIFDQYANKKDFANEVVSMLQELYESYGYTLADALSSGADGYFYDGDLDANTEYYAVAFGVSSNGAITTDVTTKLFKTLEGSGNDDVVSNNTFNISVSGITANSAQVDVVVSNNDTYYFDVVDKVVLDQYSDKKAFASELVGELVEYLGAYGIPLEYALSTGNDGYFFDGNLDANTEYYAIAFGVSSNGTITTDVTTKLFTTLEGSGNTGNTGADVVVDNLVFANYENYGDYYGTGAANWYLQLQDYAYNNLVIIEVQTALDATSFAGTFNINDTYAVGTAVSGFIYDGYFYGSVWVGLDSDENITDYLLTANGTVSIVDEGNGNYTLTIDAADENGRKLNASYTGAFELFPEVSSLSNWSNGAKFNKRHAIKTKSNNLFKKAISTKAVAPKAIATKSFVKKAVSVKVATPKTLTKKAVVK